MLSLILILRGNAAGLLRVITGCNITSFSLTMYVDWSKFIVTPNNDNLHIEITINKNQTLNLVITQNEYDIFEYGILINTQGYHMSEWSITCLSATKCVCLWPLKCLS